MTWSSKQRLSQEDLASLQKDLLALYLKLESKSRNPSGFTTDTNFGDMTQIISTRSLLKDILISLENE